MANVLGIILFALGIGITVALHEAGHMFTARAFGMRVRRYFIGFGPRIASFTRGHTEYGLAAFPVGGFCDIAGMTAQDEFLTEEEEPYAMYKKPAWQRIIVLAGGITVNLLLGFIILLIIAMTTGLPNPDADVRPRVGEVSCAVNQKADGTLDSCQGLGPAGEAGVEPGDIVLALNGETMDSFAQLRDTVMTHPGETVTLTVERDGAPRDFDITLSTVTRLNAEGQLVEVGAIGMSNQVIDIRETYSFVDAIPATARYSGYALNATVQGIAQFPAKIPGVVASIFGQERDVNGPMSVVGASRVGGELVERSLWSSFFMMLATLNFFLALFNLIPLPPFDGGHIAVIIYEKIRDALRRLMGKEPKGPADYTKLMPITYVLAFLLMAVGALIMIADVVNPIRLFG
ncbi:MULTISPECIES: RIP metalloprotease [unclassified Corynebacterium]|uniref:M50 family metallopeptidase n=1 Tax=unclassified Corynebacterium TaxID=2624378 RepID=UPI0008A3D6AF|nr:MULTISPECIES: site-2 protease family protein [unclassified Corynebacterium]OFO93796.1 signaling protein [Corynebacterium sp. HMSC034H07]OHO52590.1 signaling protein [Corynebacterium sp. HMSC035E02]